MDGVLCRQSQRAAETRLSIVGALLTALVVLNAIVATLLGGLLAGAGATAIVPLSSLGRLTRLPAIRGWHDERYDSVSVVRASQSSYRISIYGLR
jgi:hypothetical protein